MDFLKKPIVALILTFVVVSSSMALNTQIKLGEEVQKIEDYFYTSRPGEKSIYSRLEDRLAAANGLWTVLVNYDTAAAEELSSARQVLIWACQDRDISDMMFFNEELTIVFTGSLVLLNGYELTDSELDAAAHYTENFSGAQKMIESSSYNAYVLEFLRSIYDKFPARLLAGISNVDPPTLFY